MNCAPLQFVRTADQMTRDDILCAIELVKVQRETTRKTLLRLRADERRLYLLIAKYDLMILTGMEAANAPHFAKENQT